MHCQLREQAMSTNALGGPVSIQAILLGRLLGALVILFMLFDGANRLVPWPAVAEAMDRLGYGSSDTLARALGLISATCSALTTIPPTSILGAILWTGYFGDLLAAHLKFF
jgi:DoxX-like family